MNLSHATQKGNKKLDSSSILVHQGGILVEPGAFLRIFA